MRDFFVEVQGVEIPILSYEIVNGEVEKKNTYYDYQNDLTNVIARKYVDSYSRQSRGTIKDIIMNISDHYTSSIKLSNEELIDFCIAKYMGFRDDSEYSYIIDRIKESMIEKINEELDDNQLVTLDFSEELELDPDYRMVTKKLREIIRVLRKDILNADSIKNAQELGKDLKEIIRNYTKMKSTILDKINYKLKDNSDYKKNKSKAYSIVPSVVEENLDSYVDLESNIITIEEVLDTVPEYIIVSSAVEILENKKYNYLLRLTSVMDLICRKEDGSSYTNKEMKRAILSYHMNLLKEKQQIVELFLEGTEIEEEQLDTSRDLKGNHTFKHYYSQEEMDYYGHDEDTREEKSTLKK